MKSIHSTKRLYSIAASPPLKPASKSSAVRSIPTSPRPRRASLSLSASSSASTSGSSSATGSGLGSPNSRSLYTNTVPLHGFEYGPPPPPLPTSRPGNPHAVSTSRPTAGEAQTQPANGNTANTAQNPHPPQSQSHPQSQSQTQSHSQPTQQGTQGQSHHGQTHGGQQAEGGSQPLLGSTSLTFSLAAPAPPSGSSPPDRSLLLSGPHAGIAAGQALRAREAAADGTDGRGREGEEVLAAKETRGNRRIYQLDVGAYGIPKRGRERGRGREGPCGCARCLEDDEVHTLDALDGAVQVGEDAYFVREDALGVADGVGGWGSRTGSGSNRTPMGSTSHSCSSCAAASTSTSRHTYTHTYTHAHHAHRPAHRTHIAQPSPSALFARRLMHFCAREVGEARLNVAAASEQLAKDVDATSGTGAAAHTMPKPTLKHGGISARAPTSTLGTGFPYSQRKPGTQERSVWGNARPFAWPWEEEVVGLDGLAAYPEYTAGMETLVEDVGEERMRAALGAPSVAKAQKENVDEDTDPFAGTIDPVDVLERAYTHAIDAHRVRRRVRVARTRTQAAKGVPRWWTYGLGLGSTPPPPSPTLCPPLTSASLRGSPELGHSEDWEWQERWEPLASGSSTALLAVLSGDRMRVAHLGDCVGWLVRSGEMVWRSEEMWWGFNYPLQLGPASPTRPRDARRYELTVQADDILILASDGMSDNLWEEDVLDEVQRAVAVHLPPGSEADRGDNGSANGAPDTGLIGRRTLAGMLSEALCSRARRVSEQPRSAPSSTAAAACAAAADGKDPKLADEEVPFARRAREEGRSFRGGKCDDISVIVAVISPIAAAPIPALAPSPQLASEHVSVPASLSDPAPVAVPSQA
ncbi:hypothetical protein M0805_009289 [Coniferiporia weirii]|nr:hypothetical protein M0805_009289 [Coniferiporia weirii]